MKRLTALALAAALCLALCACGTPKYSVCCGVWSEDGRETDYPIVAELANEKVQVAVNDLLLRYSLSCAEEGQTYQIRLVGEQLSVQYYGGTHSSGITVDMRSGRALSLAEVVSCPLDELFMHYLFTAYRVTDGLPDLNALTPLFDPAAEHLHDFFLTPTELCLILRREDGSSVLLSTSRTESAGLA